MYIEIQPIQFQNNIDSFSSWVSILTLCLAPLFTHVFAGAPSTSYLVPSRPSWLDRLCLLNPTSIIFRYGAIVERRLRTIDWAPIDAAIANALFWTEHGWNGSESMIEKSVTYCALLPETGTLRVGSVETLKTIITTLQGVQAAMGLIGGQIGTVRFMALMALDSIFGPLAVIGLLRLFASAWLVEDYVFTCRRQHTTIHMTGYGIPENQATRSEESFLVGSVSLGADSRLKAMGRMRSRAYIPARVFRVLYLLLLLGIWMIAASWILPIFPSSGNDTTMIPYMTITSLSVGIFYWFLLTMTSSVWAYYVFRGKTTSTIVPCISHWWYKAYSVVLSLFMLAIMVLASIETTRTVCGIYTSAKVRSADQFCMGANTPYKDLIHVDAVSESRWAFGIALKGKWNSNLTSFETTSDNWVRNFTGVCLGEFEDMVFRHAKMLESLSCSDLISQQQTT